MLSSEVWGRGMINAASHPLPSPRPAFCALATRAVEGFSGPVRAGRFLFLLFWPLRPGRACPPLHLAPAAKPACFACYGHHSPSPCFFHVPLVCKLFLSNLHGDLFVSPCLHAHLALSSGGGAAQPGQPSRLPTRQIPQGAPYAHTSKELLPTRRVPTAASSCPHPHTTQVCLQR